jgi:uncharacterized protein (TIGR03083 family)
VTQSGVDALPDLTAAATDLAAQLTPDQWMLPSACPGWTVHDVFIHMACTLREVVEPDSLPPPVQGSIERTNDAAVAAYRHQTPDQTITDYGAFLEPAFAALEQMQHEPTARETLDFDDAGTYEMHLLADAFAFDHYCHLRHDLAGRGPLQFVIEATAAIGRANLNWLMAGLPQMSSAPLAQALRTSVELEFSGPGGGVWTLSPSADGPIVTQDKSGASSRIVSTLDDFLLWGTRRMDWRAADVRLTGDVAIAREVVSAIHVF